MWFPVPEPSAPRRPLYLGAASLLLIGLAIPLLAPPASAAPTLGVVATGLDNPKQPAVGPDGAVYIACSGHAGPTDPVLDGTPSNHTGSVVRVTTAGTVSTVVPGLLSRFDEGSAIGPSGLAFWDGGLYVAQGLNDPVFAPSDKLLSSPVLKVTAGGKTRAFTSFDALPLDPSATSGPHSEPDTNPFACAVGSDGRLYVSDGGDNGVWAVAPNGDATMLVQFPNDPTVTGVAAVPFPPGRARGRDRFGYGLGHFNRAPELVVCLFGNGAGGFAGGQVKLVTERGTSTLVPPGVIDMPIAAAYSPTGRLYILQFAVPSTAPGPPFAPNSGAIWSVASNGAATKVLTGLNFPTGMAFASNGDAYVTNNGIMAATATPSGSLVRVTGLP